MHMQNFIKIFQTVIDIFHEQAGDKIFTNSPRTKSSQLSGDIGHSMKFNFKFQLTFLGSCNFVFFFKTEKSLLLFNNGHMFDFYP